mmetsp:Transcript_74081/g.208809  ORF Transcript_74081/g.208809 Transcript_74081/m.208809 type:complete len:200 (+) Transcript_74081:24-623(+)
MWMSIQPWPLPLETHPRLRKAADITASVGGSHHRISWAPRATSISRSMAGSSLPEPREMTSRCSIKPSNLGSNLRARRSASPASPRRRKRRPMSSNRLASTLVEANLCCCCSCSCCRSSASSSSSAGSSFGSCPGFLEASKQLRAASRTFSAWASSTWSRYCWQRPCASCAAASASFSGDSCGCIPSSGSSHSVPKIAK